MKCKQIVLILIFCFFFLTGCSSLSDIEAKAYVIALGVDNGESNNIKLSLQIAVLSSSGGSSGESQKKDSSIISVECTDINSGISLINSYISKQIDLSHCKAIIMSEELSSNGVSNHICTLINNVQIRPDCNIIISKCSAYDFLNNSKPVFESIQANYYESILNSTKYTGYIADLYLSDFYSNILSKSSQATAILGGISSKENGKELSSTSDYMAEKTSIDGKNNVENMGTAIFKDDKLVGELNNIETLCHLIITNKLENTTITIPNPFDSNSEISIYIHLSKDTEKHVELINGYPYIKCHSYITGNVLSLGDSLDLTNSSNLEILNSALNNYLEKNINDYLYKTSKKFKSDIAGFGKYLLPQYLTWQDWLDSDWLNNYENAFFEISVETQIQSGYLFNKL